MRLTFQNMRLVMSRYRTQVSLVRMFFDTMSAAIACSSVVMWTLGEGRVLLKKFLWRTTNPLRSMAKQLKYHRCKIRVFSYLVSCFSLHITFS